jgi:biopolymer transport protein TolR
MSIYQRKSRKPLAEINVVPYIDVMLVLLVIFMITAPLLSQGVHVDLPHAKANALVVKHKAPLIVSIDKQGRYYLNVTTTPEVPMLSDQLVNRIAAELALAKQEGEDITVLVKGDKDVDYGTVVQAMVLLQHAGVSKVGLMTEDVNT